MVQKIAKYINTIFSQIIYNPKNIFLDKYSVIFWNELSYQWIEEILWKKHICNLVT